MRPLSSSSIVTVTVALAFCSVVRLAVVEEIPLRVVVKRWEGMRESLSVANKEVKGESSTELKRVVELTKRIQSCGS